MAASATLSNNVKTLLRAFCNALAPVLVSPTSFGVKPDVSPYPYNEWSSPPLVLSTWFFPDKSCFCLLSLTYFSSFGELPAHPSFPCFHPYYFSCSCLWTRRRSSPSSLSLPSPVREAKCDPAGSGYLLIKSSNYLSSKMNHRLHLTLHARRML